MLKFKIYYGFFMVLSFQFSKADYGFIRLKDANGKSIDFCAAFNTNFKTVNFGPPVEDSTSWQSITNLYPALGCKKGDTNVYTDTLLILKRGNCTFADKAMYAQGVQAAGIITVSETGLLIPGATDQEYDDINISVAVISESSLQLLVKFINDHGLETTHAFQYIPNTKSSIDPNAALLWLLAVITCAIGAWLQGVNYETLEAHAAKFMNSTDVGDSDADAEYPPESDAEIDITPKLSVIFFLMCSVSILSMYFFFDYLVYVIIFVFCYASSLAMFNLINSAFKSSPCFTRHTIPPNSIPFLSQRPPILSVVLYFLCLSFAILWAVYRKESFAWVMQDILGVHFSIFMIKTIRLPNFKTCTILLSLFFVYDVFYVFITPLFTKDHESVMVHIATGGTGKTKEELPMLFKIPKFLFTQFSKCLEELPYSMLGYGDVILPGLHVGFCAIWDAKLNSGNAVKKHVYYISAMVGYCVGLIFTFVAMYLMKTGQPALLYLVPCCLISTYLVAVKRKELDLIWIGKIKKKSNDLKQQPENERLLDSTQ